MENSRAVSIGRLIAIPALITLAVTILRLEGELHRWSMVFFNRSAGGGGALVGIAWLPIFFGPYFAFKLANAGSGPASMGRAAKFMGLGLIIFVGGSALAFYATLRGSRLAVIAFLILLVAAVIPRIGWRSFGNTLLAYAFAARIPILVVMYFAMSGNGGKGWGTHYDAVAPMLANLPLGLKYFYGAIVPQMTLWIGYTVILGSLFGIILAAVFRRGKRPAVAAGQ